MRKVLPDKASRFPLMFVLQVGEEKTDRHSANSLFVQKSDRIDQGFLVDLFDHFPPRVNSLSNADSQMARHKRLGSTPLQIVYVVEGPVAAGNLQHITESSGRNQANSNSFFLNNRVRCMCRTVDYLAGTFTRFGRSSESVHNRQRWVAWRRVDLVFF